MSVQMLSELILPSWRPLVRAQVADVLWAMLVPFVAIEALPLRKSNIANTASEPAVSFPRRRKVARCDGRGPGDMVARLNRRPEVR